MAKAISPRFIWTLVPYLLIIYLYSYIVVLQANVSRIESAQQGASTKDTNNGIRASSSSMSKLMLDSLMDNVKTLEMKVNAYLGYQSDPFYWTKHQAKCKNWTRLTNYCPTCGIIPICLDDFPYNHCVVYDFGIRAQPEFGVIMSNPPFNCEVYGFDPSPITREFYSKNEELKNNKKYHMFHYGGGGADEDITLREYNWGQVSIYSYPTYVVANPRNCTDGKCKFQKFPPQGVHKLPVRSVESIMEEFGHSHVDILKLDVEGSEYQMLEGLIESGACKKIDQISLEWHHYDFDLRYGYSSAPHLNLYVKLLREKCGLAQYWLHDVTGWPSNEETYIDMQLRLMYNLASFMRVKE